MDNLLKETFDLLTETINILIEDKLELIKRYAILEQKIKAIPPTDKPSLLGKEDPPAESVKPVEDQPAEPDKYAGAMEEMEASITDPLGKKTARTIPPETPRNPDPLATPSKAFDPNYKPMDLPWETGIPQEGLKKPAPPRPVLKPEQPGDDFPF